MRPSPPTRRRPAAVLVSLASVLLAVVSGGAFAQTIEVYENACRELRETSGSRYVMKLNFNVAAPSGVQRWETRATVGSTQSLLYAVSFFPGIDGLPPADAVAFTIDVAGPAVSDVITLKDAGGHTTTISGPVSCDVVDVSRTESKCQLALGKASRKLATRKAGCIALCDAQALLGGVPRAHCQPPYGGSTALCIDRADAGARADAARACAADCPECFTGGCGSHIDSVLDATSAAVDGWSQTVLCDDTGSPDGLTSAEASCRGFAFYALTKLVGRQARCLAKGARSGSGADTIGCSVTATSDARTTIRRSCTNPPECLAAKLASIPLTVQASVNARDPQIFCAR